jgi:O-antigen/teichoic acid export membrane protein
LGITLYVGDVLRIMATPAFHSAADIVPLILVAYVLQAWASVQDIGILVKEKTKFLTLANLASAVVAVAGYAILIPRFLQWGAAAATVLAFATRYALTYYFSQRLWPVRYQWAPVLVLVAWTVALAVVGLVLPAMPIVESLAIRTALVGVFFGGLWWLPILTKGDRESLRGWMGELRVGRN